MYAATAKISTIPLDASEADDFAAPLARYAVAMNRRVAMVAIGEIDLAGLRVQEEDDRREGALVLQVHPEPLAMRYVEMLDPGLKGDVGLADGLHAEFLASGPPILQRVLDENLVGGQLQGRGRHDQTTVMMGTLELGNKPHAG